MSRTQILLLMLLLVATQSANDAAAQIQINRSTRDRFSALDNQLTNRLHATTREQQAYIDFVVQLARTNKLQIELIVAIERYAIRRNRKIPFPYFERALRVEAGKRGIAMPSVRQFATTKLLVN